MTNAECLVAILKKPTTPAKLLRQWTKALEKEGFTEQQALELTKFAFTLMIGFGKEDTR